MTRRSGEDEGARAAQRKQERGALAVTVITVVVILVAGAPCFCYFGIGLFQGVHILRTGQTNNPARQPQRQREYKRPAKYDPVFPKPAGGAAPSQPVAPARPINE